jgi:hypothetical protein
LTGRPRHPSAELEGVLRQAEKQGWRVSKGRKYFMMKCPCPDKHLKTVHLTPQQNYLKKLKARLKSDTCWREEDR